MKYRSTSDAVAEAVHPKALGSSGGIDTAITEDEDEGKKRAAARRTAILQAYAASRSSSPKSSTELPPSHRRKEPAHTSLSPIAASPLTLPASSVSLSPESDIKVYQLRPDDSDSDSSKGDEDEDESVISEEDALKVLEPSHMLVSRHDDDYSEDSDVPEEVNTSHMTPSFSFDAAETPSSLPSLSILNTTTLNESTFERFSPEIPLAARIALITQRQAQRNLVKPNQSKVDPLKHQEPTAPMAHYPPGVRSFGLDDSVLYGSPVVNLGGKKRRADDEPSPLTPASLPPQATSNIQFPRAGCSSPGWSLMAKDETKEVHMAEMKKDDDMNESVFSKMMPQTLMSDLSSSINAKGASIGKNESLRNEPTLSIPLVYSPQRSSWMRWPRRVGGDSQSGGL